MINFKEITLDVRDEYCKRYGHSKISYYRFAVIYMWRNDLNYRYTIVDDAFCIFSFMPGKPTYCMYPQGGCNAAKVINTILDELGEVVFEPLDKDMVKELEEACPGKFEFIPQRDFYDYVYDAEKLRTLSGKKLHSKRNHANRFEADNNWEYISLTSENLDVCRPVIDAWFSRHEDDGSLDERTAIIELLSNFDALKLKGAAITVGMRVVAFTIGEYMSEDTAHIIIEKADTDYSGAYAFINREFLRREFPDVKYVDREEDMGMEGLRKSKLSYQPISLGEVFTAKLKNN